MLLVEFYFLDLFIYLFILVIVLIQPDNIQYYAVSGFTDAYSTVRLAMLPPALVSILFLHLRWNEARDTFSFRSAW